MKYCTFCGQELQDEARFCLRCGKEIIVLNEKKRKEDEVNSVLNQVEEENSRVENEFADNGRQHANFNINYGKKLLENRNIVTAFIIGLLIVIIWGGGFSKMKKEKTEPASKDYETSEENEDEAYESDDYEFDEYEEEDSDENSYEDNDFLGTWIGKSSTIFEKIGEEEIATALNLGGNIIDKFVGIDINEFSLEFKRTGDCSLKVAEVFEKTYRYDLSNNGNTVTLYLESEEDEEEPYDFYIVSKYVIEDDAGNRYEKEDE